MIYYSGTSDYDIKQLRWDWQNNVEIFPVNDEWLVILMNECEKVHTNWEGAMSCG